MISGKAKLVAFALVIVLLAVLVAGCGTGTDKKAGEDNAGKTAELAGTITIAGSTSVQPVSDALAEQFMAKNAGVKINVQGGGSSAGIKAAQTGAADLGASSRDLKEEEKGLHEICIAKDGIAVVLHPSNEIVDLTLEQLKKIYLGEVKNWKDVGGKDSEIHVINREAGSGTRGAFEEIVMGKDRITNKAIVQNSTGAVRTTVAGDPSAIGYISLASLSNEVKTVKVEGVEATADNILAGTYKVARPFLYLAKEEPTGIVKAYIDFVLSAEGQEIMKNEGLVVK